MFTYVYICKHMYTYVNIHTLHYTTLHYITSHHITSHNITLHYITLHTHIYWESQ